MVFAESWGKPLLVVHALAAAVLLGALVHNLVYAWPRMSGRPGRARAERRFNWIVLGAFAATFATGALAYPNYRVNVRAAYLEAERPAMSRLFDLKENWATLGAALAVAVVAMGRSFDARRTAESAGERAKARVYVALLALLAFLVAFNVVSGLLIVSHGAI